MIHGVARSLNIHGLHGIEDIMDDMIMTIALSIRVLITVVSTPVDILVVSE